MDKLEKVRGFITIPVESEISFDTMMLVFTDIVENILEDEVIAFTYINEQGLLVGSETVFPFENYIVDDATLLRMFSKKNRWRLSAIRRSCKNVSFVELSSPIETAEKIPEALEKIVKDIGGTIVELADDV